jgi:hypothetical protein
MICLIKYKISNKYKQQIKMKISCSHLKINIKISRRKNKKNMIKCNIMNIKINNK